MTEPERDDIDRLFDVARNRAIEPSRTLLDRLDADAAGVLDRQRRFSRTRPGLGFRRFAERLLWPAALTAATVAGFWIGSSPVVMTGLRAAYLQSDISYEFAYWFPQIAGISGGN
jgi:hypothetical protein